METMEEVKDYLKKHIVPAWSQHSEQMMLSALADLAEKCQSVEEFVLRAQAIPVTGAPEEVDIANEQRDIVINAINN